MPVVRSVEELEALYGAPAEPAIVKEVDRITPHYRRLIEASPFFVLATSGPEGLDCSPRGDLPGFVRIADERTLMLPDRRGARRRPRPSAAPVSPRRSRCPRRGRTSA